VVTVFNSPVERSVVAVALAVNPSGCELLAVGSVISELRRPLVWAASSMSVRDSWSRVSTVVACSRRRVATYRVVAVSVIGVRVEER